MERGSAPTRRRASRSLRWQCEFQSLYTQLQEAGDTADIVPYNITPQGAERSRTYDLGVDQNILGEKLTLKVGYFHNMFNHQLEGVDAEALDQYFNLKSIRAWASMRRT